jgi:hypothetical protein
MRSRASVSPWSPRAGRARSTPRHGLRRLRRTPSRCETSDRSVVGCRLRIRGPLRSTSSSLARVPVIGRRQRSPPPACSDLWTTAASWWRRASSLWEAGRDLRRSPVSVSGYNRTLSTWSGSQRTECRISGRSARDLSLRSRPGLVAEPGPRQARQRARRTTVPGASLHGHGRPDHAHRTRGRRSVAAHRGAVLQERLREAPRSDHAVCADRAAEVHHPSCQLAAEVRSGGAGAGTCRRCRRPGAAGGPHGHGGPMAPRAAGAPRGRAGPPRGARRPRGTRRR